MTNFARGLLIAGVLAASSAHAQLRFEISGVGATQIPVAVAAFSDEGIAPARMSEVIKADLQRSGVFQVIDAGRTISETAPIDYSAWKASGARALVVGSVSKTTDGRYDVRYKLFDTVNNGEMSTLSQATLERYTRLAAHKIADDVYQKLTGIPGIFSTRIAYVNENRGRQYKLEIADADGEGVQVAVYGKEPLFSATWSPDGTKITYVSLEDKKPIVMIQDLVSGARRKLVNEKGSNSAPAWSPDGSKLAVALSKVGHTQVYVMNADGSGLRRVSNSAGIDTEPRFSADGQWIYFVSDRSGGPQVYKMPAAGGSAARVTFNGGYNISPRPSPDGKALAWIGQRSGGTFSLYVMDLATGQEQRLADDATEPSFAPNSKYIIYATRNGGRKSLAVVSVDGRVRQTLSNNTANIREPAWGPFVK